MAFGWAEEDWPMMQRQILQLSGLISVSAEAVAIVGPGGHIRYVNPAFREATGYMAHEVIGSHASLLVSVPEDISIVQNALADFRKGVTWKGTLRLRRKDGTGVLVGLRIRPMDGWKGGERCYMAVGVDLSMQKSLEKQVQELQRLESLGTLANGLAHRFNNILAAISGQTELLIMSSKDPDVKQRAGKILESALRGKELVEQIGLFGRRSEQRPRLADIVPVVRNAVRFIRAAQPRCVQIEEELPEEGRPLMANTGEIHQVTLNLLTNALEAIGDKQGLIRVAVREISHPLGGEEQPCMEIEVCDNGSGIDPMVRPRIFEPFFTTRGLANSSGMGLAIAYGIVQRHGGTILCESEPGQGASFRVILPVFMAQAADPSSRDRLTVGSVVRGCILLVDKPGFALDSGKRVLESLSYEVWTADSFARAQALIADRSAKFDLLVTALHLSDGDGVDLSLSSRRARPKLPVLLCANMRETFDEERALDAGASAILRRPASREQLAEVVGKLMECGK